MAVTAVPDTGHGASVTFGTTSWTGRVRKVNGIEVSKEAVETTYLGTSTNKTFMAGDLQTAGVRFGGRNCYMDLAASRRRCRNRSEHRRNRADYPREVPR